MSRNISVRFLVPLSVAVVMAALPVTSTALTVPTPALEFRFGDATGSTVPNHGHLGTLGDGTLGSGTTTGSNPTQVIRGGYEGHLVINSNSDVMSTIDIDSIDTADSFTLSLFVKPTATSGDWKNLIGNCKPTPTPHRGWYFEGRHVNASESPRNDLFLLLGWETTASTSYTQFYTPDDYFLPGEWQHLAVSARNLQTDGSRTVYVDFYRNGELFDSQSATSSRKLANTPDGFKIGNAMWDGSLYAEYAGVAFFDEALTKQQVAEYYTYLSTPEPATLALLALGLFGLAFRRRRG